MDDSKPAICPVCGDTLFSVFGEDIPPCGRMECPEGLIEISYKPLNFDEDVFDETEIEEPLGRDSDGAEGTW